MLHDTWGWDGVIESDCGALTNIHHTFNYTAAGAPAAAGDEVSISACFTVLVEFVCVVLCACACVFVFLHAKKEKKPKEHD